MLGIVEISYLGHSSFKLKGKNVTVVTDPFDEKTGKYPKDVEADIVLVSHDHGDHNNVKAVGGSGFIVAGPGEYEVRGVSIIGVATFHDDNAGKERGTNTVYVVECDGLRIAHMGDLGHKLSQADLEEMGSIDILFVPVGGFYTVDAKTAAEIVRQVDPWVVIPMHYKQEGLNPELEAKLAGVEDFLKEMSKPETQSIPKLSITADRMPSELQVVVLDKK